MKKILSHDLFLSGLTALLLVLSFPHFSFWPLAWVAFVPLLIVVFRQEKSRAFLYSYMTGLCFFACMLYWFIHVTWIGAFCLIAYFALYFGVFGLLVSAFKHKSIIVKIVFFSCLWVMLEYLRAHLLSGFSWVSLGHSQYPFLPIIQVADITGVWGVSFIVMVVNIFIAEALLNFKDVSRRAVIMKSGIVLFIMLIIVYCYGFLQLKIYEAPPSDGDMLVAVIQANIAQEDKWDEVSWPQIRDKYMTLTKEAAGELRIQSKSQASPLIVWPETAFPGFLWEDQAAFEEIQNLVKSLGIPLLFGSVVHARGSYYNAAILLSQQGELVDQYNKLHLVPFGEYLPFRKMMPALADLIPIVDFSQGEEWTIFPMKKYRLDKKSEPLFSVLVCFEDTMASLSRGFVRRGAKLLINMTNDAWFKKSKASTLHMVSGLFRSVENRRVLVRAANTGVSCVIRPTGEIVNFVGNKKASSRFIDGVMIEEVSLLSGKSFYTKFGDLFILGAAFFVLIIIALDVFRLKKQL